MNDSATQQIAKQNGWMLLGARKSEFVCSVAISPYTVKTK